MSDIVVLYPCPVRGSVGKEALAEVVEVLAVEDGEARTLLGAERFGRRVVRLGRDQSEAAVRLRVVDEAPRFY